MKTKLKTKSSKIISDWKQTKTNEWMAQNYLNVILIINAFMKQNESIIWFDTKYCWQENKAFVCHWLRCCKSFGQFTHLKGHQLMHSGIKPFKCDSNNCNKSFTQKRKLKRHQLMHSGIKTFKCDSNNCNCKKKILNCE
jgi:uncharacterized Zn-finger protein